MADRFPSLDDFDAGQTEVHAAQTSASTDEPSDFLARERAALGDDAKLFSSVEDAEDDDDDDDLLGGGGGGAHSSSAPQNGNYDDLGDFESSFPTIDTANEAVAPGGTITGSTLPYHPPTSYTPAPTDEPDTEPIRAWRETRDQQIHARDQISAEKKASTVKAAQQAIDDFYENYNNRKDKSVAQTRKDAEEFLKNREDTTSGGTSWERIAKLVDLSGKGSAGGASGTPKARMREVLLSLRKDEDAPGAKGY